MTITELKYIVALAKEQHFGHAADSVFVSQPTLSIGIKKLEEELGVQIFERLSNKAIPTQAGKRIIEAAQQTLMCADTIKSIAKETQGQLVGDIKLGAIFTICPYLLPRIIPDLQQQAPDINLYIEENYTHNLIDALKNGTLDIALISLPVESTNLIQTKPLFEEAFHVIMPKNHPLADKPHIAIENLNNERVFLLGGGNCFRDQVLSACPNCLPKENEGQHLIQGGSLETIRMMIMGHLGISVFPEMALNNSEHLVSRPFAEPVPKRKIALAWRKSFIQQSIIEAVEASVMRSSKQIIE